MATKTLNFTKPAGSQTFEATFDADDDFNLYIKFDRHHIATYLSCRNSADEEWSEPVKYDENPFNHDVSYRVYPKQIRVTCKEQPTLARVTTND